MKETSFATVQKQKPIATEQQEAILQEEDFTDIITNKI